MPRVVHFEIHAEDPARAVRFYSELFGWECTRWEGPYEYWLVRTGPPEQPGIDGGIMARMGGGPLDGAAVNAFVCTVDVASLDEAMARATSLGGSIAVPRMPVQGIGWLAYGKDTEGNLFGMMQTDPAAA